MDKIANQPEQQQNVVLTQAMDFRYPQANMFQSNPMTEILKELFDKNKIAMISDLTDDEIKLCTRITAISELMDLPDWKTTLNTYVQYLLSRKRQSRREIIEALGAVNRKKTLGQRIKEVFKPGGVSSNEPE